MNKSAQQFIKLGQKTSIFQKLNQKSLKQLQTVKFSNNIQKINANSQFKILNFKNQQKVYTIHYDDSNQEDVSSLTYSQFVEKTMKDFIEALKFKGEKGPLIIDALKKLEGAKFGIDLTNPQFKHFVFYIQRHLNKEMSQQEYFEILQGVFFSGIADSGLWGSLISYLRKFNKTMTPQVHLRSLYYITDFKIPKSLDLYIEQNKELILSQIDILMKNNEYQELIFALNMTIKAEIQIDGHLQLKYLEFLVNNKNRYFGKLEAYHFTNVAYVLYTFIQQSGIEYSSDIELQRLNQNRGDQMVQVLKDSIDCFINLDMMHYDSMLKEYEYTDKKSHEIGIFDKTDWSSISRMMVINSDPEFFDNETFKRLEDILYRKSETDVIDVQNAGIMLECYSQLQLNDINGIMLIIQMLDARLKAEKEKAKDGYEANVVIRLVQALLSFEGTSVECLKLINTVKYFGGAIKHGALVLDKDQAFELKLIYEDCPYTQNDPEIVKKLDEILERFENREKNNQEQKKEFSYTL